MFKNNKIVIIYIYIYGNSSIIFLLQITFTQAINRVTDTSTQLGKINMNNNFIYRYTVMSACLSGFGCPSGFFWTFAALIIVLVLQLVPIFYQKQPSKLKI